MEFFFFFLDKRVLEKMGPGKLSPYGSHCRMCYEFMLSYAKCRS
jgi:hypothetical protein